MSHETQRQKDKKNKSRPKAGEIGHKPSIQKNYHKKVESKEDENQMKLL